MVVLFPAVFLWNFICIGGTLILAISGDQYTDMFTTSVSQIYEHLNPSSLKTTAQTISLTALRMKEPKQQRFN